MLQNVLKDILSDLKMTCVHTESGRQGQSYPGGHQSAKLDSGLFYADMNLLEYSRIQTQIENHNIQRYFDLCARIDQIEAQFSNLELYQKKDTDWIHQLREELNQIYDCSLMQYQAEENEGAPMHNLQESQKVADGQESHYRPSPHTALDNPLIQELNQLNQDTKYDLISKSYPTAQIGFYQNTKPPKALQQLFDDQENNESYSSDEVDNIQGTNLSGSQLSQSLQDLRYGANINVDYNHRIPTWQGQQYYGQTFTDSDNDVTPRACVDCQYIDYVQERNPYLRAYNNTAQFSECGRSADLHSCNYPRIDNRFSIQNQKAPSMISPRYQMCAFSNQNYDQQRKYSHEQSLGQSIMDHNIMHQVSVQSPENQNQTVGTAFTVEDDHLAFQRQRSDGKRYDDTPESTRRRRRLYGGLNIAKNAHIHEMIEQLSPEPFLIHDHGQFGRPRAYSSPEDVRRFSPSKLAHAHQETQPHSGSYVSNNNQQECGLNNLEGRECTIMTIPEETSYNDQNPEKTPETTVQQNSYPDFNNTPVTVTEMERCQSTNQFQRLNHIMSSESMGEQAGESAKQINENEDQNDERKQNSLYVHKSPLIQPSFKSNNKLIDLSKIHAQPDVRRNLNHIFAPMYLPNQQPYFPPEPQVNPNVNFLSSQTREMFRSLHEYNLAPPRQPYGSFVENRHGANLCNFNPTFLEQQIMLETLSQQIQSTYQQQYGPVEYKPVQPIRIEEHLPPIGEAPPQNDLHQKFKSAESENIENFLMQSTKPEENKSMDQKLDEQLLSAKSSESSSEESSSSSDEEDTPVQTPRDREPLLEKFKSVVKPAVNPLKSKDQVQPQESNFSSTQANYAIGQQISVIRVAKHAPNRKNIHEKLIFWSQENTDDYRFSKYLEQNRYNRLFNEIDLIGEGGFGKVYKAQHALDQRIYAVKKIKIHLGVNYDFKQHSVYREILGISQVLHKNVVRYHACWIESVTPNKKIIQKSVKKVESNMKKKFKLQRQTTKIIEEKESVNSGSQSCSSDSDSESFDENAMMDLNVAVKGNKLLQKRPSMKLADLEKKYRGKNLLGIMEVQSEVCMDEDWNHQREDKDNESESGGEDSSELASLIESQLSERKDVESEERSFDDGSSSDSSSESSSSESGSSQSNDDSSDVTIQTDNSLYQLIEKEKDFITLNVMIQMEFCTGDTLRALLDDRDYKVNRKVVYHLFKQLLCGLQHIHEEGLIHRDIKPANIFIDKSKMLLKIGDFGLAKQSSFQQELQHEIQGLKRNNLSLADLHTCNSINIQQTKELLNKKHLKASLLGCKQISAEYINNKSCMRECEEDHAHLRELSICAGTPMYQAPEQTMQQIQIAKKANQPVCLTEKVDMFAAGLILYEMCAHFKTQHQRIQKFHQLRTQRVISEDIFKTMPEEKDIILNLTDPDPKKRSSAIYLLNSRTFQSWSFEVKQ